MLGVGGLGVVGWLCLFVCGWLVNWSGGWLVNLISFVGWLL